MCVCVCVCVFIRSITACACVCVCGGGGAVHEKRDWINGFSTISNIADRIHKGEERKTQIKSSAGDGAAIIKSDKVERLPEPEKKQTTAGEKSDRPIVSAIDRFLGNCCTRAQNVMETKQNWRKLIHSCRLQCQHCSSSPPPPPTSNRRIESHPLSLSHTLCLT